MKKKLLFTISSMFLMMQILPACSTSKVTVTYNANGGYFANSETTQIVEVKK